jgi:hypothetical protein
MTKDCNYKDPLLRLHKTDISEDKMAVNYFKPLTWDSFQTTEILLKSVDRRIEHGTF